MLGKYVSPSMKNSTSRHNAGRCRHIALTPDIVEYRVDLLVRQRVDAPELRVKIQAVGGYFLFLAVDPVIYARVGRSDIFEFDAKALKIRHLEVRIKPLARVAADHRTADLAILDAVGIGEKVGQRHIDRGRGLTVEINSHKQLPAGDGAVGYPDMLDRALAFDIGKHGGFASFQNNVGVHLPVLPQLARGCRCAFDR